MPPPISSTQFHQTPWADATKARKAISSPGPAVNKVGWCIAKEPQPDIHHGHGKLSDQDGDNGSATKMTRYLGKEAAQDWEKVWQKVHKEHTTVQVPGDTLGPVLWNHGNVDNCGCLECEAGIKQWLGGESHPIWCKECEMYLNGEGQITDHCTGHRHKKNVRRIAREQNALRHDFS